MRKCCFCLELRAGLLVYGWLLLAVYVLILTCSIYLIVDGRSIQLTANVARPSDTSIATSKEDFTQSRRRLFASIISLVLGTVMHFILLIGIYAKRDIFVKIFLGLLVGFIVIEFLQAILLVIVAQYLFIVLSLITLVFQTYMLFVVRAYLQHRSFQGQHRGQPQDQQ